MINGLRIKVRREKGCEEKDRHEEGDEKEIGC